MARVGGLVVLLAALALGLAACSGDETAPAPAEPSPPASAPEPAPPPAEPSTGDGGLPVDTGEAPLAPTAPEPVPTEPTSTGQAAPEEPAPAPAGEPRLEVAAEGLSQPVLLASPPDDPRRFVVEQTGTIRLLAEDGSVGRAILDVSDRISSGSEQGLLGLAFDPGFADNGRLYVDFTDADGDTQVVRYVLEGDGPVDPDAGEGLLTIEQPYPNHNGGHLAFGPDGFLYVGTGDGGSGGDPENRGQDPDTLLGKLLRLDVSGEAGYAVPPDNPFADGAGGRPEIWALGLRNPWRFSFDGGTGDLWIGDVGQNAVEEIDRVEGAGPPGANYGWRVFEGRSRFDEGADEPAGYVPPVFAYSHDLGCSVTGGVVVRDPAVPALAGRYLFGDYCTGTLWAIDAARPRGGAEDVTDALGGPLDGLTSFGVDSTGAVYLLQASGTILRLVQ
ncbi:MAG: PQQ-dependent sugar dehydrogenase [Thermoleophilia bacterium]